jgi:hypothetical protein
MFLMRLSATPKTTIKIIARITEDRSGHGFWRTA